MSWYTVQSSSPPLPPWKCNARTVPRVGERVSTGHKTRQWVRAANAGQHSRPSPPRPNPSDTTINFQGCPAHRAGQRGSHKPATAAVGSYSLVPALPMHERPSRGDAGHRRDRASPHPTPVSTLHALGACVSTTAWAAASPARGPPTRGGGRGAAGPMPPAAPATQVTDTRGEPSRIRAPRRTAWGRHPPIRGAADA